MSLKSQLDRVGHQGEKTNGSGARPLGSAQAQSLDDQLVMDIGGGRWSIAGAPQRSTPRHAQSATPDAHRRLAMAYRRPTQPVGGSPGTIAVPQSSSEPRPDRSAPSRKRSASSPKPSASSRSASRSCPSPSEPSRNPLPPCSKPSAPWRGLSASPRSPFTARRSPPASLRNPSAPRPWPSAVAGGRLPSYRNRSGPRRNRSPRRR